MRNAKGVPARGAIGLQSLNVVFVRTCDVMICALGHQYGRPGENGCHFCVATAWDRGLTVKMADQLLAACGFRYATCGGFASYTAPSAAGMTSIGTPVPKRLRRVASGLRTWTRLEERRGGGKQPINEMKELTPRRGPLQLLPYREGVLGGRGMRCGAGPRVFRIRRIGRDRRCQILDALGEWHAPADQTLPALIEPLKT